MNRFCAWEGSSTLIGGFSFHNPEQAAVRHVEKRSAIVPSNGRRKGGNTDPRPRRGGAGFPFGGTPEPTEPLAVPLPQNRRTSACLDF